MAEPTLVECGLRCDCAEAGRACPFFGRHPLRPDPALTATVRGALNLDENNVRKDLNPAERSAATTEPKMPDVPATPVSPTGVAVIAPTGIVFKVLLVVVAIASAVALKQPDLFPNTDLDQQIATIVVALLGFISPGLRKSA